MSSNDFDLIFRFLCNCPGRQVLPETACNESKIFSHFGLTIIDEALSTLSRHLSWSYLKGHTFKSRSYAISTHLALAL